MTVLLLAFLGGALTILSPCILPVIPLVFARVGRDFRRETVPMLVGLAVAFTMAALVATATARWLLVANEFGRYAAIVLLMIVGVALLSVSAATVLSRPFTKLGAALLAREGDGSGVIARNVLVGMAIGLLWAPCAGPILGLLIAIGAKTPSTRAALLFFTFAAGAAMSLALVSALGSRAIARLKRAGAVDAVIRRTLGLATLATVLAIFFGWDRAIFAKGGLVQTAGAEEPLVSRLAPALVAPPQARVSLDAFAREESGRMASISLPVADGMLVPFDGGTEWINSAPITPESLRGKVVLVEFWTFECYNCLNVLPHVKELYRKYGHRRFVVIGVHTPEFARERVPENVRSEVRRLGINFPVVIDNDNRIWNAYHNQYWPAMYFADATGKMRFHHFGEGRYDEQDKVVARLLAERYATPSHGER